MPVADDAYPTATRDDGPHCGFQYLQCATSWAYLFGRKGESVRDFTTGIETRIHPIQGRDGQVVGGLLLHRSNDSLLFQTGPNRIELIAVAKGWTKHLPVGSRDGRRRKDLDYEDVTVVELTGEENWAIHQQQRNAEKESTNDLTSEVAAWVRIWKGAKAEQRDCYHVLWIEWQVNIAYRKASGFVLAEAWEEYAEPEKVKVMLR